MLLLNPQVLDQLSEEVRDGDAQAENPLLARLRLLSASDRTLVEMALKHNLTRRQIASLLNITSGSVTRRLQRIVQRLRDPLVIALSDRTCTLPPEYRQLGIEYFLHRETVATLARRHQLSRGEIEKVLQYIRGWHRGICSHR